MDFVIFAKKSVRFPGKHSTLINGRRMIDIVASKLVDYGQVILYSKDPDLECVQCRVVRDSTDGIITDSVLSAIDKFGTFFAVAGDMPFITHRMIERIIDSYDGRPTFPIHADGLIEPLFGIYTESVYDAMHDYIESGGKSLIGFLNMIDIESVPINEDEEKFFTSINYPEDIEKYADLITDT
ncbi:molybdenum cofactor guanylyltransferase [Thermoplasma sp.]|uniref:molybdenum cofactor guanylyltransferase n=1 Tax=Thermoplasma sp. TaxID=1973142 RepID=UPI001288E8E2|nr:molybdenum cofactor guanylyltransferase [Thermoplasma sp.]KAA8922588.1 MAG: molybdenum cofactor guanylyltransferase [Thermoplasma sp.]